MSQRERRSSKSKVRASIVSHIAVPHYSLSQVEKRFLLYAERGDCASIEKILAQYKDKPEEFNIDCLDPLNRSALIIALEKENIDLIQILLNNGINVKPTQWRGEYIGIDNRTVQITTTTQKLNPTDKRTVMVTLTLDALLHAINEDYVEGVEVLLQWEEKTHVEGSPYSWESVEKSASGYTPDITPVILAAHKNNYEILKLLLDRGASLPATHDIRCGCDECVTSKEQDSLRHSQSRINAYKAMISPSLICLSSRDPLLTAFELYNELKRLEKMETEFRAEYHDMKETVQTFASSLLDHVRTSSELDIILNYDPDPTVDAWEPGERPTLERLKLSTKYKLKAFVAHPNVQQLLASIWYAGLPAFRRKTMIFQMLDVYQMACMFPVYATMYMLNPDSPMGIFLRRPFVKFVCHSASYATFLGLLALASQRVERLCLELFGNEYLQQLVKEWAIKERGSFFGLVESMIVVYVLSLIWKETRALYQEGLAEYLSDLWNILDFCANTGYTTWITLRLVAFFIVHKELEAGFDPWYPRDKWHLLDPHTLSECAFASSMILSFMKLVNIFSVNPHLGPLQISLGRMIIDIIKFFFIYTLVLFAFGCGMNQLLWYFAGLEENKCYHRNPLVPDFEHEDKACTIWRRFANLFETSQSLFWASFGLVDLTAFDLTGIKSFTRFWAMLIFGCYSVINIIVLLNMLIAMMSNSYQIISERADVEWKFARSKLFISYFEEGDELPPPFNLFPSVRTIQNMFKLGKNKMTGSMIKKKETNRERADLRYDIIMQQLVRRYITAEQKKLEEFAVTEDDIAEVRHDISTLRFELIDIFKRNDFKVPKVNTEEMAQGRKDRLMERRIIKDFQIGMVEGVINEIITGEQKVTNLFSKIAKAIGKQDSKKKDWNALVRQSTKSRNLIGSTDEAVRKIRQQSVRRYIIEYQQNEGDILKMDTEKLVEYNPALAEINPTARIAYAKFKMNLIKSEYDGFLGLARGTNSKRGSLRRTASIHEAGALIDGRRKSSLKDIAEIDIDKEQEDSEDASSGSIVRPRPSSMKLEGTPGILPRTSIKATEDEQAKAQGRVPPSSTAEEPLPTIVEILPTNDTEVVSKPSTSTQPERKDHTVVTMEPPAKPAVTKAPITPKKVVGGNWL